MQSEADTFIEMTDLLPIHLSFEGSVGFKGKPVTTIIEQLLGFSIHTYALVIY